jgi:ABC-type cobalamin transport system ATPase subunit
VLLLKGGRALASGERDEVLAPGLLAETFGAKVTLRRAGGRYRMEVGKVGRAVC